MTDPVVAAMDSATCAATDGIAIYLASAIQRYLGRGAPERTELIFRTLHESVSVAVIHVDDSMYQAVGLKILSESPGRE